MKASEKIRQEAKRTGVNLHDLAECVGWSDPTIYRHLRANNFEEEDLVAIAVAMNTLHPDKHPVSAQALRDDPELPDELIINGIIYRRVE